MAFLKIVDTLQQAFAPWTCVRAILEASAIAAWLLDDNISAEERVKRSFSFRYESMEQELKFLRAKKYNESKTKARIAEVESWAVKLGFAKVKNRKGKRIGIGLVFPKMIEVTRDVLDMEDAYRILSGMAHGRSWVVNQLGLRRVGQSTSDFGNPLVHLKQQMPAIGMVHLSQLALSAYGRAVESQCRLFGWEPTEIERITQSVDEVIQKAAARLAP